MIWTCSRCEKPQAADASKTFVPVAKQADDVWTTVAVCVECAKET